MASRRHQRQKCEHRIAFKTEQEAHNFMSRFGYDAKLSVYKCPYNPNHVHFGHKTLEQQQGWKEHRP